MFSGRQTQPEHPPLCLTPHLGTRSPGRHSPPFALLDACLLPATEHLGGRRACARRWESLGLLATPRDPSRPWAPPWSPRPGTSGASSETQSSPPSSSSGGRGLPSWVGRPASPVNFQSLWKCFGASFPRMPSLGSFL
ncbi:unnamed protein product [Rangifer tarandus platyrhynchus]|uniref:Uncharacterized protein n=1 Tax=Rangifer tarandus platyrhynchus TaxID=3082113 RepID=A0AC59ZMU1_RANTA